MKKSPSGFTLMETLLAIAVVAVLLTSFLAVFGPATATIRRAISAQDADRLVSALETELSTLREDERTPDRETAFAKAFEWIQDSSSLSNAIVLFNYRGDSSNVIDGELAPYTATGGTPGTDYTTQSAVRRLGDNDDDLEELMQAAEGRAFVVRMRQLVADGQNGLVPAQPGADIVSAEGISASSADDFEDAAIAVKADFYALPATDYNYLTGPLSASGNSFEQALNQPLFSRNLAVRR